LDRTAHFYKLAGSLYNPVFPVMSEQKEELNPSTEIDEEDEDLEMHD
jgi:hypothetical protein